MFCYKCGAKIPDGAAFCHKCGAKLNIPVSEPKTEEISVRQQVITEPGKPETVSAATENTEQVKAEPKDTEKSAAAENPKASAATPEDTEPTAETQSSSEEESSQWWSGSSPKKKLLIVLGVIAALILIIVILRNFGIIICLTISFIMLVISLFKGSKLEKIIAVVVLGAFVIAAINSKKPGAKVRNSYLTDYSTEVTIGEAFESYFDNAKWSTYEDDVYSYVVFIGVFFVDGERTDARITFKITGENSVVDSIEVNGQEVGYWDEYAILSDIYDEYE